MCTQHFETALISSQNPIIPCCSFGKSYIFLTQPSEPIVILYKNVRRGIRRCCTKIPISTCFKRKTQSRKEIMLNLISAGIEPNPGPERDSDDSVTELSILTINCNGLSSDIRLLQAIGKIKKYIKNSNCIIFLQETHNANITLLESIWTGTVHISIGTGGSRGVITLCTQNLKTTSFCADHNGRYVFTTVELGKEKIVNTANIYSPNNHDDSYRFIDNTLKDWNMYCESTLIAFPNVMLLL